MRVPYIHLGFGKSFRLTWDSNPGPSNRESNWTKNCRAYLFRNLYHILVLLSLNVKGVITKNCCLHIGSKKVVGLCWVNAVILTSLPELRIGRNIGQTV